MRTLGNRVTASVALTALLACSGMGLCWRIVDPSGHGCCPRTAAVSAPAKACDSRVAGVEAAKVLPPPAAVAPFVASLPGLVERPAAGVFAPSFAVRPPPLVLRI